MVHASFCSFAAKYPSGQEVHAALSAAAKVPAGHGTDVVLPSKQALPAKHARQSVWFPDPVTLDARPGGHPRQRSRFDAPGTEL